MKIWMLQSLLVCPIILSRVSLTMDDWIYGWRPGLASLILTWCSPFTPRATSHVTNGIIFCVFSTLAISVLQICSEVMSKRTHKDSGEGRVAAKSKPMMNSVSQWSEKAPAALSSTASESPVKTRHKSQTPLSPQTEKLDRTDRPVVCTHSSSYSTPRPDAQQLRTQSHWSFITGQSGNSERIFPTFSPFWMCI